MVVGEGIISALGYQSGGQRSVPIGPALLASVLALLILIAPGAVAVHYGHRAYRAGRRETAVPAWIGGMTGGRGCHGSQRTLAGASWRIQGELVHLGV